YLSPIASPLL
nr:Chain C, Peptide Y10L [Toxoplasma gondii]